MLSPLEIEGVAEKVFVEVGAAMGYPQHNLAWFVWLKPKDARKKPGLTWKLFTREDVWR